MSWWRAISLATRVARRYSSVPKVLSLSAMPLSTLAYVRRAFSHFVTLGCSPNLVDDVLEHNGQLWVGAGLLGLLDVEADAREQLDHALHPWRPGLLAATDREQTFSTIQATVQQSSDTSQQTHQQPSAQGSPPKEGKKKKKGKRVPPKVTWPPPRFSFIANTVIVKIDRLWGGESGHHPTQEAQLVCASATNRACHHYDTRGRKCQLWGLFLPGTTQSIFS